MSEVRIQKKSKLIIMHLKGIPYIEGPHNWCCCWSWASPRCSVWVAVVNVYWVWWTYRPIVHQLFYLTIAYRIHVLCLFCIFFPFFFFFYFFVYYERAHTNAILIGPNGGQAQSNDLECLIKHTHNRFWTKRIHEEAIITLQFAFLSALTHSLSFLRCVLLLFPSFIFFFPVFWTIFAHNIGFWKMVISENLMFVRFAYLHLFNACGVQWLRCFARSSRN